MKSSIAITVLILLLGLVPGLVYQKRAAVSGERARELREEAERLGIRIDGGAGERRTTKRRRSDDRRAAKDVAAEFRRFAAEIEQRGAVPRFDPEMNRWGNELVARLADLGPAELRRVLKELREAEDLSQETRRNLVSYVVLALSSRHPETAAKLAAETADLLGDSVIGGQALLASMARWAERDPQGAQAWIEQTSPNRPGLRDEDVKRSLLGGVAANDPAAAFRMLGTLGFDDAGDGVGAIMETASKSPEQRDAVLGALRGHLAGMTSPVERERIREEAFAALAQSINPKDFDASVSWLQSAGLDNEELAAFATGIGYFDAQGETGRWIDWFSTRLPIDNLDEPVREMMGEWTQQDYLAAGNWLAATQDGPGKHAAVAAYAEAVAEYEPQVAVQWAMTLPDNWRREQVLRTIHENWPADDPRGAAEFAEKHGVK